MFIQLTNKDNVTDTDLWINLAAIVAFYSDGTGGTRILLSRESETTMTARVTEEPYKVWARIRTEGG